MTTPSSNAEGKNKFNLNFVLTTEDYWNFNKYAQLRRLWGITIVLAAMTVVLLLLYFTPMARRGMFSVVLTPSIIVLLLLLVMVAAISVFTRLQVNRMARDNPNLFSPITMTVDSDSIKAKTGASESVTSWTAFTKIEEDKGYIYLFCAPMMAVIVPKRAFPTVERANEFFQFATNSWLATGKSPPRAL